MPENPTIGVLALQGAFDVHAKRLAELGATTLLVRKPEQLDALDALVLPGGESTTFLKHLERAGFYDALNAFVHTKPVFGTCAGCILLAKDVTNPPNPRSASSTSPSNATPTAARTTPPSSPAKPPCPAARSRWSSSAPPASPASAPTSKPSPPATAHPPSSARAASSPPPSTPNLTDDLRVHRLFLDIVRET